MIFRRMANLKGEHNPQKSHLLYKQILGSSGNNLLAVKNTPFCYRATGSVDFKVIFLDETFRFHFLAGLQKQMLGFRWGGGI